MTRSHIARHRTALRRRELSRPIKLALEDAIISDRTAVFDYGCGHGDDVKRLRARGVACRGWDPVHNPEAECVEADVVNLGYVLNVIEAPAERKETLQQAFSLARQVLVVSARLGMDASGGHEECYGDGFLTRIGTFQKYYEQGELRALLEETLACSPVAAAPGVFYVFRDGAAQESFLARRQRHYRSAPRVRKSEALYEQHKDLLQPLLDFVGARGRLPERDELADADAIVGTFGSLSRAFALVRRVTGSDEWEAVRAARGQELLVYLALARFRGRPSFSLLPRDLQLDVKAFFASYKRACAQADALLFDAGKQEVVNRTCRAAAVGKQTPAALYVHVSALQDMHPVLRVYEGCARAYIGTVGGANIVKLHRDRPAVSYLAYPDFESNPHPALARSLLVLLDGPRAKYRDYTRSESPPILHRKEEFIDSAHPLREKFARLTRQEEAWGLYVNPSEIGTKLVWERLLARYELELRGHRLVRSKGHRGEA